VIEYAMFLHGLVQTATETKFGKKVAYGLRMMLEHRVRA